jgi:hypothetical protein
MTEQVDRIAEGIREHLNEIGETVKYTDIIKALKIVTKNYIARVNI